MDANLQEHPEAIQNIRNVGIIAHIDAGKTTLTERILYATKEIRYMGEVHEGTTVTDWMQQERERGISITAAAVTCHWKQWKINLVDTPGHIDFTAEVERSLSVLDGVIAVFCAVHGVQAQSENVWRRAKRYRLPALAFINKMDREGASPEETVRQMRERLGMAAVPVQFPIGSGDGWLGTLDLVSGLWNGPKEQPPLAEYELEIEEAQQFLIESLAEVDDEVLECYLNGARPEADVLKRALRRAVIRRKLVPVFYGSSLHNAGVRRLLDGVGLYLPSPLEHRIGEEWCCGEKASALTFRVARSIEGMAAYVRVLSGTIRQGTALKNSRNGVLYKVESVQRVQAAELRSSMQATSGEIVALTGSWQHLRTGDALIPQEMEVKLPRPQFPRPVVSMVIESSEGKCQEMASALKMLAKEDPTLKVRQDAGSTAWIISGMGELHLEIVRDMLKMDFGIDTRAGRPRVEYLETIRKQAEGHGIFEKRLYDGRRLEGQVALLLSPLKRGSGMKMDFSRLEATLPKEGVQAVRQGVASIVNGENTFCSLADIMVTVSSASFNADEASEVSLLNAARLAMQDALNKGEKVVLEPVMQLEVNVPSVSSGSVISDLSGRRARISSVESVPGSFTRIVAFAPLAELFGYASSLRSLSAGRGEVVAEPASYEPVATL